MRPHRVGRVVAGRRDARRLSPALAIGGSLTLASSRGRRVPNAQRCERGAHVPPSTADMLRGAAPACPRPQSSAARAAFFRVGPVHETETPHAQLGHRWTHRTAPPCPAVRLPARPCLALRRRENKTPTKNIGWRSCVLHVPRETDATSSGADRTLPGTGGRGHGTFKWRAGLHVRGVELPLSEFS